jgi:hypothetical protein
MNAIGKRAQGRFDLVGCMTEDAGPARAAFDVATDQVELPRADLGARGCVGQASRGDLQLGGRLSQLGDAASNRRA